MTYYDDKEVRDEDTRQTQQFAALQELLRNLKANSTTYGAMLEHCDPKTIHDRKRLAELPVLRKSSLKEYQSDDKPFGGLTTRPVADFSNIYQSPGPIYEAVTEASASKRTERFLHAIGVGAGDVVHNSFSYHFTPAGLMLDAGARKLGATVFPAGVGQTELQARAASDLKASVYIGTPDYLKTILEKADELGLNLNFKTAGVSGGALFSSLREFYEARGIKVYECYATAELGLIAYQTAAMDGMVVDEDAIVEIVRPGTTTPVADGEVGEIVVTILDSDYPLIRLATGDMSKVLEGRSACGRTNMRLAGWMGRADQATKVKGMFVRPEQIARFVEVNPGIQLAKAVISRDGEIDKLHVQCEATLADPYQLASSFREIVKLRAEIEIVSIGSLPKDGLVIEDRRKYI